MLNPKTTKLLIIAEATRVIELINEIPKEHLQCDAYFIKEKAELKNKMAELRRDTIAMEKLLSVWGFN